MRFIFVTLSAAILLTNCHDKAFQALTLSKDKDTDGIDGGGGDPNRPPNPGEIVNAKCDTVQLLGTLGFDDPYASCMWNIINRGQAIKKLPNDTYYDIQGTSGADFNISSYALEKYSGKGINIHVSDDSFDATHPDLKANFDLTHSKDCRSHGMPPYDPDADVFHGVMVSGIIAAVGKNGLGTTGIAYQGSISAYNPFACRNFIFAADVPGVDIWNGSYGTLTCDAHFQEDQIIFESFEAGATKNNVLYVKAAGNDRNVTSRCKLGYGDANRDPTNTLPYVMPVAALDNNGQVTSYSSPGANLFVAAPAGYGGRSESPGICTILRNGEYTCSMNGTSAASPNIAGLSALIKEANPRLGYLDIMHILALSARPVQESQTTKNNIKKTFNINSKEYINYSKNSAGYQHSFNAGFGLPDGDNAVKIAESYSNFLPKLERYSEVYNVVVPESSSEVIDIPPRTCVSKIIQINNSFQVFTNRLSVSANGPISDFIISVSMPDGVEYQLVRDSFIQGSSYAHSQKFKSYAPFATNAQGNWEVEICNNNLTEMGQFSSARMELWGYRNLGSLRSK